MRGQHAVEIALNSSVGYPTLAYPKRRSEKAIQKELEFLFGISSNVGRRLCKANLDAVLVYESLFADTTERDVIVESMFMFSNVIYLSCFCKLRKRKRTFRADRIRSIVVENQELACSELLATNANIALKAQIPLDILDHTDFFVHPKSWGDCRRPMGVLLKLMMSKSIPKSERFSILLEFASTNLSDGNWVEYSKQSKAAGQCLLILKTDLSAFDLDGELATIRGGRFSKAAFDLAVEQILTFCIKAQG